MSDQDATLTERRAASNRRRQREWVTRQRAAGRVPFSDWVSPEEAKILRELLASLRGERQQAA